MTLYSYLTAHDNKGSKALHTHTWFAKGLHASSTGTLYIPPGEVPELHELLIQDVSGKTDLAVGHNSITEKVIRGSSFRFFADLDFSAKNICTWKDLSHNEDFAASLRDKLNKIVALYVTVVAQTTGSQTPFVLATRLPYKMHLHFPDIIVTASTAKLIAKAFSKRLEQEHADMFTPDVVDESVYSTGLRLLYCHKGTMINENKREAERTVHESMFGPGSYCDVYFVTDSVTWVQHKRPSLKDLQLTSIHIDDEIETTEIAYTPVATKSSDTVSNSERAISTGPSQLQAGPFFCSWVATAFGLQEKDIRWSETTDNGDRSTIPTRSNDCPFVQRKHKNNHLYFILHRGTSIELRCHDADCKGRNSSIKWSAIPTNVQVAMHQPLTEIFNKNGTSTVALIGNNNDACNSANEYLSTALNKALQKQGKWCVRKEDGRKNTSKHNIQYTRNMERDCLQQPEFVHEMPGTCSLCVYTQSPGRAELVCAAHGHRDITVSHRGILEIHATYRQKLEVSGKLDVNVTNTTKSETTFERLKLSMIAIGEERRLMRGTDGSIYAPIEGLTYAYVRSMSAKAWLNDIFLDNNDFSNDCQMIDKLEKTLRDYEFSRFPRFQCNRMYLGFRNGLLRIDTCEFIPKSLVSVDIVARKFFNTDLDTKSLQTPLIDSILCHQFDDDVIHMFYILVGRLFFYVGERDKWQTMMYLYGEAQTGKSTIIRVIMNMFNQVAGIDSSFDKKFGIGGLYDKELIVIDDLPRNIKECFPQQVWQSMVSGGPVTVRLMNTTPFTVDWLVQQVWGGNWLLNYDDSGQVSRRVMSLRFEKILAPGTGKANLDTDIIQTELPSIMYKALCAYRDAVMNHKSQLLYDWCPEYFKETRDELRSERNPLYRFLTESPDVIFEEGARTSGELIRARFARYLSKPVTGNLSRGTFTQANSKWIVKAGKACKSCWATTGKGCCANYQHAQRKSTFEVLNLSLISTSTAE